MKCNVGEIYDSNNGKFKIIRKIKADLFTIEFINTGFITNSYFYAITKGQVKDLLIPSVYGVGILGYANKKDNSKYYSLWQHMLGRCYDVNHKDYKYYGEKGVTVCERWFRFDYFLEDVEKIDGYSKEKYLKGKLELDKDIKQYNNNIKEYNIVNCSFVSKLNNLQYRKFSIQKEFIAKSPNGEIHYGKNIQQFCREYNLTPTHVSRCLRKLETQHKKWQFYYLNEEIN